ncbi:MAG: transketolase [Erysipelotrichaceae bacterium]|nr:transketolase [Erysipelotrichaceae bacterium]
MESRERHALNMRRNILKMIHRAQSGHPGGSLSCTDILTALYFGIMNINEDNLNDVQRDKLILSKGHASAALYAALAEKGFISEEELMSYSRIGSRLQGHPNMNELGGVDMSTGSLGMGLSAAVGMCLANKLDGNDFRTYVICGDGELQEGQIWEAAMAAGYYRLDNLLLFVDHNGLQGDGCISEVMNIESIGAKFAAFNWNVLSCDGHDIDVLIEVARYAASCKTMPTVIIAETVKGKGVSFMEDQPDWHGKAPNDEQLAQALAELGGDSDE